jgi:Zn-dependent peptidase ImmA (M78 family)
MSYARNTSVDEFDAVLGARRFIADIGAPGIPVDVIKYAKRLGIDIRYSRDISVPGYTVLFNGKFVITIEEGDRIERQRFTICHELGHLVLNLPTSHDQNNYPLGYTGRPKNEILCDVFAATVLLPDDTFKPLADSCEIGFVAVDRLSEQFNASRTAVASRLASVHFRPCAYVLTENDFIRFVAYSRLLREWKAWVTIGGKLPTTSLAAKIKTSGVEGPIDVDPAEWFEDWRRHGTLREDARYHPKWNQTLSLLWFEDDEIPPLRTDLEDVQSCQDDDEGLKELDGTLPWPGKHRRRP